MYTTSIGVGVAYLFALAVGLIQIRKYFIVGLLKLT